VRLWVEFDVEIICNTTYIGGLEALPSLLSKISTEVLLSNSPSLKNMVLLQKISTLSRKRHGCYYCNIIAPGRIQKWLKAYDSHIELDDLSFHYAHAKIYLTLDFKSYRFYLLNITEWI